MSATMLNKPGRPVFPAGLLCIIMIMLAAPAAPAAAPACPHDSLIVYYSRTGKSETACRALQKTLGADILEIKDLKDRSGTWGFISAGFDAFFDRTTEIEPYQPDFSPYCTIIMVTPIWNWKVSTPIRTLIETAGLEGKKLVMVTTANIEIKKYEQYGDDAPFIKRFLRDYLREKSSTMRSIAKASGAQLVGHYHIATQEATDAHIAENAVAFSDSIRSAIRSAPCGPLQVASHTR